MAKEKCHTANIMEQIMWTHQWKMYLCAVFGAEVQATGSHTHTRSNTRRRTLTSTADDQTHNKLIREIILFWCRIFAEEKNLFFGWLNCIRIRIPFADAQHPSYFAFWNHIYMEYAVIFRRRANIISLEHGNGQTNSARTSFTVFRLTVLQIYTSVPSLRRVMSAFEIEIGKQAETVVPPQTTNSKIENAHFHKFLLSPDDWTLMPSRTMNRRYLIPRPGIRTPYTHSHASCECIDSIYRIDARAAHTVRESYGQFINVKKLKTSRMVRRAMSASACVFTALCSCPRARPYANNNIIDCTQRNATRQCVSIGVSCVCLEIKDGDSIFPWHFVTRVTRKDKT